MRKLILMIALMVSTSGLTQTFESPLKKRNSEMEWYEIKRGDYAVAIYGKEEQFNPYKAELETFFNISFDDPYMTEDGVSAYRSNADDDIKYHIVMVEVNGEVHLLVRKY